MKPEDVEYGREYLIELLQHNEEVTIEFNKKDGSKRKMKCTLLPKKLPKREVTEGKDRPNKEPKLDIIPVFDLEKKAWRSFRVDSVTAFSFSI